MWEVGVEFDLVWVFVGGEVVFGVFVECGDDVVGI